MTENWIFFLQNTYSYVFNAFLYKPGMPIHKPLNYNLSLSFTPPSLLL